MKILVVMILVLAVVVGFKWAAWSFLFVLSFMILSDFKWFLWFYIYFLMVSRNYLISENLIILLRYVRENSKSSGLGQLWIKAILQRRLPCFNFEWRRVINQSLRLDNQSLRSNFLGWLIFQETSSYFVWNLRCRNCCWS